MKYEELKKVLELLDKEEVDVIPFDFRPDMTEEERDLFNEWLENN